MDEEQRVKPKKADGTLRDHGKGHNTEFPPLMGGNQKLGKETKWTKRKKETSRII